MASVDEHVTIPITQTPLQISCLTRNVEIVKQLLQHPSTDPNAANSKGVRFCNINNYYLKKTKN